MMVWKSSLPAAIDCAVGRVPVGAAEPNIAGRRIVTWHVGVGVFVRPCRSWFWRSGFRQRSTSIGNFGECDVGDRRPCREARTRRGLFAGRQYLLAEPLAGVGVLTVMAGVIRGDVPGSYRSTSRLGRARRPISRQRPCNGQRPSSTDRCRSLERNFRSGSPFEILKRTSP